MNVDGIHYRTIWIDSANKLKVIDQLHLPHAFEIATLHTFEDVRSAISDMLVRGAGLIGATAGYGMWLAAEEIAAQFFSDDTLFDTAFFEAGQRLQETRPTAKNLSWAVERQIQGVKAVNGVQKKRNMARLIAEKIADEDAQACKKIGEYGLELVRNMASEKGDTLHILTHCNAGWLAFVDYGSALAPVYAAHDAGIPVHVWVDETRPRNQGASLTAWELARHGVPHDIIVDNAGGHLMRSGLVDMVITGADRVTRKGDVANKIGTYLKALAAADNGVPFYVALPSSTFDFTLLDGNDIPIEERSPDEVLTINGLSSDGTPTSVQIGPAGSPARNWAFDVTPARLITGLICERGICAASPEGIASLFPELRVPYDNTK